ncbi:acetyl-CoA hydrolase [bacterium]|nr:acetyl-CoA hydrolase [bacterium]
MSVSPPRVDGPGAVARIPAGARVLLPHGCIEPHSVFDAIGASTGDPTRPPRLYAGLHFGSYGFLGDRRDDAEPAFGGLSAGWRFVTWQVGPAIRRAMSRGRIGFLPARFRDLPRLFGTGGPLAAEVVVLQCAPPRGDVVNLGISCSIFPAAIEAAKLVVAEIHPDMPWTRGSTEIPLSRIGLVTDATRPLCTLARSEPDDVDRAIVECVLGLVPEGAWVQLGVGAVPDCILARLADVPGVRLHSGMLTDGLVDFLDRAGPGTRVVTGELEGSLDLYRRAASDPRVELRATTLIHDVPHLGSLERFVSINSALEVDLSGQVNGEAIDGVQVSGVGGSLDFVEAARYSPGGMSIVALRSTARGRSRIVARLAEGTPVSVPRFAVDVVVTEHGVARLAGLDLEQRARALVGIAAPEARRDLAEAFERRSRGGSPREGRDA